MVKANALCQVKGARFKRLKTYLAGLMSFGWTWPSVEAVPDPLWWKGWSHCLSSSRTRAEACLSPGTPVSRGGLLKHHCSAASPGLQVPSSLLWLNERRAMLVWIVSALGSMPQIQDKFWIWVSTPISLFFRTLLKLLSEDHCLDKSSKMILKRNEKTASTYLKKFFLILFFLPIFWETMVKDLGNTRGRQMVGVELREFLYCSAVNSEKWYILCTKYILFSFLEEVICRSCIFSSIFYLEKFYCSIKIKRSILLKKKHTTNYVS